MPGIATGDRAEEKGGGLLPRLGQDTGLHSGQPASDLDGMTEYISTQKVLGAGLFRCVNLACCAYFNAEGAGSGLIQVCKLGLLLHRDTQKKTKKASLSWVMFSPFFLLTYPALLHTGEELTKTEVNIYPPPPPKKKKSCWNYKINSHAY